MIRIGMGDYRYHLVPIEPIARGCYRTALICNHRKKILCCKIGGEYRIAENGVETLTPKPEAQSLGMTYDDAEMAAFEFARDNNY